MTERPLRTTVVRRFPVPEWLKATPNEQTLRDAVRRVLDLQERIGLDVVGDGELGRSDLVEGKLRSLVAGRDLFVGHRN